MQPITIRTLVVDDSVFYRGILSDILKKQQHVDYLGHATNGKNALVRIEELRPDLVTLDVEMPEMNGIEVLQYIRQHFPDIQVVMISASTRESARHTIEALRQGALDFIAKPTESDQDANVRQLHRQLRRVLSVVETRLILKHGKRFSSHQTLPTKDILADAGTVDRTRTDIVVIGVSTGGPQSLPVILEKLPSTFNLPILVVQHLPSLFVSVLVDSLNRTSELEVVEVRDNLPLRAGVVYIAPGGSHTMVINNNDGIPVTRLSHDPPENFCRPSVDYMFRSVADVYGSRVLAIIMTGMGKDGVAGMKLLKSYGATTIAQDEASSIVFGMPMEAIKANIVDHVLPLDKIASAILQTSEKNSQSCRIAT